MVAHVYVYFSQEAFEAFRCLLECNKNQSVQAMLLDFGIGQNWAA